MASPERESTSALVVTGCGEPGRRVAGRSNQGVEAARQMREHARSAMSRTALMRASDAERRLRMRKLLVRMEQQAMRLRGQSTPPA